jgi:hypothetical protein
MTRDRLMMGAVAVLLGAGLARPASAETVDAPNLFKAHILKCLHPTVSPDKASYEQVKGPETKGDTTATRVKVFYAGLMGGKNALEADLLVRQAGSIRQMRVNVLSDTGSSMAKCPYTANWTDF